MQSRYPKSYLAPLLKKPRYEHKYIITIEQMESIRQAIADAFEADPHASKEGKYYVNSLYYDTREYLSYFEKIDGIDPRFKIRARYYGEKALLAEEKPSLFLESKIRMGDLLSKLRVKLQPDDIKQIGIYEPLTLDSDYVKTTDDGLLAKMLQDDHYLPVIGIKYTRFPYISKHDRTLRLTFDTQIHAASPEAFLTSNFEEASYVLPKHLCVMEIKFHYAMPLWLQNICSHAGLLPRRYSKYASGFERFFPEVAHRELRMRSS